MYNFNNNNNTRMMRVENKFYFSEQRSRIKTGSYIEIVEHIDEQFSSPYEEGLRNTLLTNLKELKELKCTRKQFESNLIKNRSLQFMDTLFEETDLFNDLILEDKRLNTFSMIRALKDTSFIPFIFEKAKNYENSMYRYFLLEAFPSKEVCDMAIDVELGDKNLPYMLNAQLLVDFDEVYEKRFLDEGYFEYLKRPKFFRYVLDKTISSNTPNIGAMKYILSQTDDYDEELFEFDLQNKDKYTRGGVSIELSKKTEKFDERIIRNLLPSRVILKRTRAYDRMILDMFPKKRKVAEKQSFSYIISSLIQETSEHNLEVMENFKYLNNDFMLRNILTDRKNILEYAKYCYEYVSPYFNHQLLISKETDEYDKYFIKNNKNRDLLSFIMEKDNIKDEDFLEVEFVPAMINIMKKTDKYDDKFLKSQDPMIRVNLLLTKRVSFSLFENDPEWVVKETLRDLKVS